MISPFNTRPSICAKPAKLIPRTVSLILQLDILSRVAIYILFFIFSSRFSFVFEYALFKFVSEMDTYAA